MIALELLKANWKLAVFSLLLLTNWGTYELWQKEVHNYADFKSGVVAAGKAQAAETERINAEHANALKGVSDDYKKSLPTVRNAAVAQYLARHPGGVLPADCHSGTVPGDARSSQGADETRQECVPDEGFIRDAAEDALKVGAWQKWATRNRLPIGD
jgi:hypothetical protein